MSRLLILLMVAANGACAQPTDAPTDPAPTEPLAVERTIAVTVDDLPGVGGLDHLQRVTRGLLSQIATAGVSVTGFVNEGKLEVEVEGERDARAALLQAWVDAGLDLGNHTYSHPSLFDTPLADFQDQVRRGDVVTNRLLAARGDSVRYFRHPYLNPGPTRATKQAFEAWLADEGYTIAPVTHDNEEYVYARAYDRAAGDDALRARIADAYVAYMDTTAGYYEKLGRDLFGREMAHVLLIHANALNADHLGALLAMFERRGYRFVSLDEALDDSVYQSDDTYVGRSGTSWLQRWATTRGAAFDPHPPSHEWVWDIAYPDR